MSYAPILAEPKLDNNNSPFSDSSRNPVKTATPRRRHKSHGPNGVPAPPANPLSFIVHCHLSWDWVWQRPQQFISRLSQTRKILFVEMHRPDPELVAPSARLRSLEKFPNVSLLQVQFPLWRWHNSDWVDRQRCALLREALSGPLHGQFERPIQWFYDPMTITAFENQL